MKQHFELCVTKRLIVYVVSTMPVFQCPIEGCAFQTDDVDTAVAAVLLTIHNNVHLSTPVSSNAGSHHRAPKLERPKISSGSSEETWNTFSTRWSMFKRSTGLSNTESLEQLFHCCDEDLGDAILKGHPNAVTSTEENLLKIIKQMAVIPVAISVRRADLLNTKQDQGENVRAFYAKVRGKAATCSYLVKCTSGLCSQAIDFTNIMVKDVVISGLVDDDLKREVLGWPDLDEKSLEDTISFIEAKEMARDALDKGPTNAGISGYKKGKNEGKSSVKISCKTCKKEIDKYVYNKRQKKTIEVTMCLPCWKKANPKKEKPPADNTEDETGALLLIGGISSTKPVDSEVAVITDRGKKEIILDHHIFHSKEGWRKSESMPHPTLRLLLSTDADDYNHIGVSCPLIKPTFVVVVSDTGAMSALWGLKGFYKCGFSDKDLIPIKRTMRATHMNEIEIYGAVFVRLTGTDSLGRKHTAAIMAYVSPSTDKFYLPREALIQLSVIPKNFPKVGAALESSAIDAQTAPCGCLLRTLPPGRPKQLPFTACPENIDKMKEWLKERYASSTWNKCTHQVLKGVTGPPLKLHVDPDATPRAVHVPSVVPLHWEKEVEDQLMEDVRMGVLEKVPHGYPTKWCHRLVVTQKPNGKLRRTVDIDMSALNKVCQRETHHVKPPFHQAKSIPPHTWKTVTDAWNGFHCVPLAKEDREYTTFITHLGRFWYLMAPQGALGSGDGYSRRYDEIIADVKRKTKCVDDVAQWDTDIEDHWWRIIDFLELLGHNGVLQNFDKFQFCQRAVDFAGFHVNETELKPLEKYLRAISEFPTPTRTTDIRSWFGLVHQVSHYNQLTKMLEPFKPFLSPKVKFEWNDELDKAFEDSKKAIIDAIKEGVEIFDPLKHTCLQPDFSEKGIGYFLSQKHCSCFGPHIPGLCEHIWRITLAGSRFLRPAETRYAPVEGEALAIAWSLEHTKYFTLGNDKLVVVTDHKPLVNLLSDKALDQIVNPRLFSLKQRTLPWRFSIYHKAGIDNKFSDATSRNPVAETEDDISNSEVLAGIMLTELGEPDEDIMSVLAIDNEKEFRAVTWEVVKSETGQDESMIQLTDLINSCFPDDKNDMPLELQ